MLERAARLKVGIANKSSGSRTDLAGSPGPEDAAAPCATAHLAGGEGPSSAQNEHGHKKSQNRTEQNLIRIEIDLTSAYGAGY